MPRAFVAIVLSVVLLIASLTSGCSLLDQHDPHSYARPEEARVTSMDLDINVDFEGRKISGTVRYQIVTSGSARQLILDTRDMKIRHARVRESDEEWVKSNFEMGEVDELLGQELRIPIHPGTTEVAVEYSTGPNADALQWLSPEQTADGVAPFLFTQSQPILARSWVPCQDSPEVRVTYRAKVRVPPGMRAVMSAVNSPDEGDGVFEFEMPQPIPSYLMALAVGKLEFLPISERAGVYAEPSVVEAATWEFADTEKMIQAAEKLYGKYRWERYDILVLPPSFPWGGMENPRLTFCTPTVIAGDRSLVALIAHELAHSWSGNLVTNARWDDFWLNEGFTVYFEHRIMEEVYGRDYDEMLALLGYQELQAELEKLDPADTSLKLDLCGRHPEEAMTSIPYEKGYFFLRHCEETVGRAEWDRFLAAYFDRFAFQSVTTEIFIKELEESLIRGDRDLRKRLAAREWIYGPGLPEGVESPSSQAFARVEQGAASFLASGDLKSLETTDWSSHEWLHFLRQFPHDPGREQLELLDAKFHLTESRNSEVACQWLQLAISAGYEPADARLREFLLRVGRLKFLGPLYQRLLDSDQGELARAIYGEARKGYHPIARRALDETFEAAREKQDSNS